jgi:hypothetical protein
LADPGPVELAAGIAARSARPPDLAAARAHFESAARDADDRTAAEALFFLAELDDAALEFASALARYEAAAARLPSSRHTPRANSRAHELRTHAEGGFAPLVRLDTVRRSPDLANDPSAIDALAHDAASFPPGKVRVEARMLVIEAYLGRLHRSADAVPLLLLVIDDPHAEVLTARAAASELVSTYTQTGNLESALGVARAHPRLLPPTTERDLRRTLRRRPLRVVAWGDLTALAAFALLALARPGRGAVLVAVRRVAPLALAFSAVACGVGGLLASRYEQTSPYPFTAMLPAVFAAILLARAWSAGGSARAWARALRAAVSFAGVFAAAFLMLDRMDPVYLQGFGL